MDDLVKSGEVPGMDLSGSQIAGMIRAVRGMFPDGLHLLLQPAGVDGPAITARLEEGRRYLDSDPSVLFSRYGLAEQEWTLVGIVGHQAAKAKPMTETLAQASGDGFPRTGMIRLINGILAQMGQAGLMDMPQTPGAAVVPLAVYRMVGVLSTQPDA